MFIYLLQVREALRGRPAVLAGFAVYASVVWVLWAIKTVVSRRYEPYRDTHRARASVIVPVVDEPVPLFTEVLTRILKQRPHQTIVVINGARNPDLEDVCNDLGVEWLWTPTAGKRNAIRLGVDHATGDICVLVDSDTLWTRDTLPELLKPFADPRVGGVTTRQRIWEARDWNGDLPVDTLTRPRFARRLRQLGRRARRRWQLSKARFIRRWADWLENSRARYSLPMQSVVGQVGCLPGRTIAFRTSVLQRAMYAFMTEKFLGVFLEVSDDRNLTNLCLKQGYRTVYQETSLVYTDCPVTMKKLARQQLRWARGSQYNTMRMTPWMVGHAPLLGLFFVADIALPFLLLGTILTWIYRSTTHTGVNFIEPILRANPPPWGYVMIATYIVAGSTMSMWLRQFRHLAEEPRDYLWMPAYILFSTFVLMPIRLIGFTRMAHTVGWGTRHNAYAGHAHRLNPKAALPYLLAAAAIGAELALLIRA